MFQGRRGFVRMASVAAGASCLALAACSSAASSAGAPSATSTADPLASLTASRWRPRSSPTPRRSPASRSTVPSPARTGPETIHVAIKPGQGCTGTMGTGSRGSFKLTKIGDTVYLNPDKKFWESFGGANASQVITLVDGRYLKVSSSDKAMGSLASICDVKQMFSTNGKQERHCQG